MIQVCDYPDSTRRAARAYIGPKIFAKKSHFFGYNFDFLAVGTKLSKSNSRTFFFFDPFFIVKIGNCIAKHRQMILQTRYPCRKLHLLMINYDGINHVINESLLHYFRWVPFLQVFFMSKKVKWDQNLLLVRNFCG